MRVRSRIARISAAVAAAILGGSTTTHARVLTWDSNGVDAPLGQDGNGQWNETDLNWVDGDLTTGTNVAWNSTTPDSAIFGNATSATVANVTNTVSLASAITVQDWSIGTGANGGTYNFNDFAGGSLTIAGNVSKITGFAAPQIVTFFPISLTAGNHTFAINDTGGDAAPELRVSGELSGAGGVTLNNGSFVTWGSLAFNVDNSYTGATNIEKGRLIITTAGALGATSAGTTIGALGTLSIGGAGTTVTPGGLNVSEPITITRNTYAGTDHTYPFALFTANGSGTNTLSGGLVVDSTDARIRVETSRLIIPGPITQGATIGPDGLGKVSFTGDFAGFVELQGDNSALKGGFEFRNGVEVQATSQANIGGPNSKLSFVGDATLGIMNGFMTDFGTHVVNYDSFSGGLNIPDGQVFTLTQPITGGAGMGKRGTGTLNFNATVTRTANVGNGGIFWDGGIVNINANHTVGAIHLRDPIVNIADGVTLTTNGGYSSVGQDTGDTATVNILGSGRLIASGDDFNVADNAGTGGTINIPGDGTLSVGGLLAIGKNTNAVGVINKAGGTVTVGGELWVGQGGGTGTFTNSGGTVSVGNWVAIGRAGGNGTFNLTGGTFNKTGGGQFIVADNSTGTMTMSGATTALNINSELWVGQAGNGNGTFNLAGGNVSVGSWIAIGREGGKGTVTQTGGTLTKNNGGSNAIVGTSGGTGTYNLSGGSFTNTASETWIAEGGTGTWNLSGTGVINTALFDVGHSGGNAATLNVSGSGALTATTVRVGEVNSVSGTINLDGGSITANQLIGRNSTGQKVVNFNGGTLRARQDNTAFLGGLNAANVKDGGAIIDSNGFNVTAAQPLLASGTGGLTKNGAGTLTLTGASTYTGGTTANAGKLAIANSLTKSSSVNAANDSTIEVSSGGGSMRVIKTPSVTIATNARIDLKDNKLLTDSPIGTYSGGAYTGVQGQIARAYDFGSWDLPGLMTSMPDAGPLVGTTTIGISDGASVAFLAPTETGTFAGQTITGATTIAVYTYAGDVNFDGLVDASDYGIIDNYFQFPGTTGYANGDFNYDGVIDAGDYGIIDNSFQLQGAPIPMAGGVASAGQGLSGVTAVPEPASLSIIGLAAASLVGRRRRRTTVVAR